MISLNFDTISLSETVPRALSSFWEVFHCTRRAHQWVFMASYFCRWKQHHPYNIVCVRIYTWWPFLPRSTIEKERTKIKKTYNHISPWVNKLNLYFCTQMECERRRYSGSDVPDRHKRRHQSSSSSSRSPSPKKRKHRSRSEGSRSSADSKKKKKKWGWFKTSLGKLNVFVTVLWELGHVPRRTPADIVSSGQTRKSLRLNSPASSSAFQSFSYASLHRSSFRHSLTGTRGSRRSKYTVVLSNV